MGVTPETLLNKTKDFSVCVHKYKEQQHRQSLICFFEGKHDIDYYYVFLRSLYGEDIENFCCNCKSNVIKMYGYVQEHQGDSNIKKAFFIDRDFDGLLNNSEIFETDRYSIENYYCSESVFEKILKFAFHIDNEDEILKAKEFYRTQFAAFHSVVAEFNAFYSLVKKENTLKGKEYKVQLNDKFPTDLATIKIDGCVKNYDLMSCFQKYNINDTPFSQVALEKEVNRLCEVGEIKRFRGKYEIEFMQKLIIHLVERANNKDTDAILHKKISYSCNSNTFMNDFSQYADEAVGLKEYILSLK